jgi:hypothetical protein
VVACVLTSTAKGTASQEVETFGTMTRDLERLARWLGERGVEQVALESTGVYTRFMMLPRRCTGGSM